VGQKELISLLAPFADPWFTDDLYKCDLINICLCAMADGHPEAALEILNHAADWNSRFFNHLRNKLLTDRGKMMRLNREGCLRETRCVIINYASPTLRRRRKQTADRGSEARAGQ
jgi:hypothetical protein